MAHDRQIPKDEEQPPAPQCPVCKGRGLVPREREYDGRIVTVWVDCACRKVAV